MEIQEVESKKVESKNVEENEHAEPYDIKNTSRKEVVTHLPGHSPVQLCPQSSCKL